MATSAGRPLDSELLAAPPNEPLPLLPGIKIKIFDTTGPLVKDPPYSVDGFPSEQGVIYSSSKFLPGTHIGLVILCHGQLGKNSTDQAFQTVFDDLARCLAVNGFVVASIRHNDIGQKFTHESFIKHTRHLLSSATIKKRFALEGKPVAFVGHSESGPGAIEGAKRVSNLEISNVIGWIQAVVCLAPTDISEPGVPNAEFDFADSLLVLQGTHDGDTPAGGQSIVPYERSIFIAQKHFCWIHGGNHTGFLTGQFLADNVTFDAASKTAQYTQRMITWNYVTAFLRWRMNAEVGFRPIFVGDGSFMLEDDPNSLLQKDLQNNLVHIFPRYDTASPSPLRADPKTPLAGDLARLKLGL